MMMQFINISFFTQPSPRERERGRQRQRERERDDDDYDDNGDDTLSLKSQGYRFKHETACLQICP